MKTIRCQSKMTTKEAIYDAILLSCKEIGCENCHISKACGTYIMQGKVTLNAHCGMRIVNLLRQVKK